MLTEMKKNAEGMSLFLEIHDYGNEEKFRSHDIFFRNP